MSNDKLPQAGDLLVWFNADPFTGMCTQGTALCIGTTFDKSDHMDSCTVLFSDVAEPQTFEGVDLIKDTFSYRQHEGLSFKVVTTLG